MPLWRNSLIFIRNSKTVRAPRLEKASQPLRDAGLTVDLHIRYGKRVPEIVKFADESSADLVVISSHRIDPEDPSRTWMTISHQLAILVTKPVLIVK